MNPGKLRHRLAIQSRSWTVDDIGERTGTWSTLDTVWGQVRPLSGSETMRAQQAQMDVTHEITIRYGTYFGSSDTELLPEYRFVYDGRFFRIRSIVNPEERNIMLICLTEETV